MAAVNIVSVTTINGRTTGGALTTSTVSLLSNAASSSKLLKINSIIVSNIHGTNSADATISWNTAAAGAGTNRRIVSTVTVPADGTMVVLGKDSPIYLDENQSITGLASANSSLEWIISYEDIS